MESPAGQRAEEPKEWAKGQHPGSLESSGARVTKPVLVLSTSAQGPLVRASLSTSPALPPHGGKAFSYFSSGTLFLAPTPHNMVMGYPISHVKRETQWQEKSSCHKNSMRMPKGLLLAFPKAHLP